MDMCVRVCSVATAMRAMNENQSAFLIGSFAAVTFSPSPTYFSRMVKRKTFVSFVRIAHTVDRSFVETHVGVE